MFQGCLPIIVGVYVNDYLRFQSIHNLEESLRVSLLCCHLCDRMLLKQQWGKFEEIISPYGPSMSAGILAVGILDLHLV
jgi:hypothetical protein